MNSELSRDAVSAVVANPYLQKAYRGRSVLVLGADGFLGSYLALTLKRLGAKVSIVSRRERPMLADSGVAVFKGDLCSTAVIEEALPGQEIVFDMAGASGGIDSNRNAAENLSVESAPHLKLFEAASRLSITPLIVFCSTRTVYGKPQKLPVDEAHPTNPGSIYAVHKLTLERYLQVFHSLHGLRYVIFRLSNPYGPFPWQEGKSYGVLNQFISRSMRGGALTLFGKGEQLRDYIFIEDVVDVFLKAAIDSEAEQKVFNLGGPSAISMKDAVSEIVEASPGSSVSSKDWPTDYKAVETGDYVSDNTLLERTLGWKPRVEFAEGLKRTLAAYRSAPSSLQAEPKRVASDYWTGRKIVVTGAGGSLGSFMCGVLSKLKADVTALYRSDLPTALANNQNVTPVMLDLTSSEPKLEEVFADIRPDAVFHFAACPDGQEGSDRIFERIRSNTIATNRLLEAARLCGTRRFLIADSCKVYGNAPVPHQEDSGVHPESSYAATKHAAWLIASIYHRNHGLPVAALRPTLIYGPGQAFNLFTFLAKCVKEGKSTIQLSGGKQTRDPIFITDAVRAYLEAAQNIDSVRGRAIPIGGGKELSVLELSRRFLGNRGKEVRLEACAAKIRPGEILRSYCDNRRVRELFDWSPEIDIDTGLEALAEYLFADESEKENLVESWQQRLVDSLRGSPVMAH